MRVKIQQFLFGNTLMSWAIVGQNIGRSLIKLGHDVEFVSTDEPQDKYIPNDLKEHVRKTPTGVYDMQISYTAMHNFPNYLRHGNKNRFGIWNLDSTVVPKDMVKWHNYCDQMCPSSDFAKQIFLDANIPESKLVTVPHGINIDEFKTDKKYKLKTTKNKKILLNIATPHKRKNIKNTLNALGKAFTNKDDVCLVIKVNTKKQRDAKFHVNFIDLLSKFKKKFKNHPEIELVQGFIPSLAELYNSCDIIFMMSNLECFWLPGLEALVNGKIVIATNHGGQLQYLNKDNSVLIDGKIIRMPTDYQYWVPSPHAKMFDADINHAVKQLRYVVNNYDDLLIKLTPNIKKTVEQFTWCNVAKQFLEMCK